MAGGLRRPTLDSGVRDGNPEARPEALPEVAAQIPREGFELLLAWFHPDRNEAARRYESMRSRLMYLLRDCRDPGSLADKVFDIAARRLARGEQIEKVAFFSAVARMLKLEAFGSAGSKGISTELVGEPIDQGEDPLTQLLRGEDVQLMRSALARLPSRERTLMFEAHRPRGAGGLRRRALATRYQKSENALNIYVHDIRRRLKELLAEARGEPTPPGKKSGSRVTT